MFNLCSLRNLRVFLGLLALSSVLEADSPMTQPDQSSQPAGKGTSQPASQSQPAAQPAMPDWQILAAPVVEGAFVRPADAALARPIWGHADGLRVGLWPMPGPRGLLRIYTPYLGHDEARMINFIAVEPILVGQHFRGFSELEPSKLDKEDGKRIWAADAPEDFSPRLPHVRPARGIITSDGDVQILQVYVMIEAFDSGARPYLRLTFRSDRRQEVGIASFAQADSKPIGQCIISATMGNYARLRELHLADKTALAGELWPAYRGNDFAPHRSFPLDQLGRKSGGELLVAATPDEDDPASAKTDQPLGHWEYTGKKATQYWRCDKPDPALIAQVNGRFTYWRSKTPIPGGIAFENFELVQPFSPGQELWFGVTTATPEQLRK